MIVLDFNTEIIYNFNAFGDDEFALDGNIYKAEEGMTWHEWVFSDYNTGYNNEKYGVYEDGFMLKANFNSTYGAVSVGNSPFTLLNPNDTIKTKQAYVSNQVKSLSESNVEEFVYPNDWEFDTATGTITKRLNPCPEELVIPSTIDGVAVKEIGSGVFQNNESLKKVTVSEGIEKIGNGAFSGCTNLEEVTIPDTVTYIGSYAFAGSIMTSVSLPTGITYIGEYAFIGGNITELTVPGSLKNIPNNAFSQMYGLTTVIIEYGVENIGNGAFDENDTLKNIQIPNSVKTIGQYAFASGKAKDIYVPNSVISIGSNAFTYYGGGTYESNVTIQYGTTLTAGSDNYPWGATTVTFEPAPESE